MEPGYREPGKPRRRIKKWEGASWTPPNVSAELGEGEYCKRCKKTHGYMTLKMQTEKRGEHPDGRGKWVMMWICPNFLHVVKEVELGKADPSKPYKKIDTSQMRNIERDGVDEDEVANDG